MSFTIIATHSAEHIAKKIVARHVCPVLQNQLNKDGKNSFPDGEQYVQLPQVEKLEGRVIVLHSGMPEPDSGLRELEMVLDLLKNNARINVEVFFLYFPYCMQDEVSQEGEINAAERLVHKLITYYGIKKIYAIDPHFAGKKWVPDYPFVVVPALKNIMDVVSQEFPDIMYVAPDAGSQRRTKLKGTSKRRTDSYTVELLHDADFAASVKGKAIGAVDDLVETGSTMVHFHNKCKYYGAKQIVALVTHGVLPIGISRIKEEYEKLFLTNTIDRVEANIDITDLVVESIITQ